MNVRIGKNIGIIPLNTKWVKRKNRLLGDHLLFGNHSAPYGDFSILTVRRKCFY